jgi:hypothetical protein
MKFSKCFYITTIIISLLACNITLADTCYDPNYDRYYQCGGDDYIAPVVAAVLFSAILSNMNNDGYRGYGGGHHGGGFHGGHGGYNGRHH